MARKTRKRGTDVNQLWNLPTPPPVYKDTTGSGDDVDRTKDDSPTGKTESEEETQDEQSA